MLLKHIVAFLKRLVPIRLPALRFHRFPRLVSYLNFKRYIIKHNDGIVTFYF